MTKATTIRKDKTTTILMHMGKGLKHKLNIFSKPLRSNNKQGLTMCEGKTISRVCPIREHCMRYKAKADPHYQAWYVYLPYNFDSKTCESFISEEQLSKLKPAGNFFIL